MKDGGLAILVDVYEDYVIKTPKSKKEIKEKVRKFLEWQKISGELNKRTNRIISDTEKSTKIIKRSSIYHKLLANLEFLQNNRIKQKKVTPLFQLIPELSKKDTINLFDKIIKFQIEIWKYGMHKKTFKFFSNFGIDNNSLVLIDAFELTSNKKQVLKQIKKDNGKISRNFKNLFLQT